MRACVIMSGSQNKRTTVRGYSSTAARLFLWCLEPRCVNSLTTTETPLHTPTTPYQPDSTPPTNGGNVTFLSDIGLWSVCVLTLLPFSTLADRSGVSVVVATVGVLSGLAVAGCVAYLCRGVCAWYTDVRGISVLMSQLLRAR